MALVIKRVEYYNVTVEDQAGAGSKLLSLFAGVGVSWLAFKAVPLEPRCTRFTLFPDDGSKMTAGAKKAGLELDGPHSALLIQGDDESGALADIYEKLAQAEIHVNESSGIADINGGYGVLLYLKQEDCEKAVAALER
jgi:D-Tyr-tRNAtyr deacylase